MIDVGKRIKELRELAGISGRTLALSSELDPSQISKIEKGVAKPSLDALERICEVIGISLSTFFASDTDLPPDLLQLIETTKKLTPEERKNLNTFLRSTLERAEKHE